MYYPCSENKGADQLRSYREADLRLCFRLGRLLVFPWGGSYIESMIKLQKRAARIILDKGIDTSSKEMFKQLSWMEFPERVTFQKAVMMYKIFNNLTPSYLPNHFKFTSEIHVHQRSLWSTTENLLYIPKPNTELYRNSLAYSGSKIWNAIPEHIKQCAFKKFKKGYLRWKFKS